MSEPIRGLYAIVDPQFLPAGMNAAEYTRQLLEGGCRLIQLRVKRSSVVGRRSSVKDETLQGLAREIMSLKRDYDFTFILNDDVACARELRADGVHLGEDDMSIPEARKILGPEALIGYSSHSIEEAVAAQRAGANYVALGAIFKTSTKGPGHPVQGVPRLSEVVELLTVPVVAIGGINRTTVEEVWRTGVAAVAMITGLSQVTDPKSEVVCYLNVLQTTKTDNRKPTTDNAVGEKI